MRDVSDSLSGQAGLLVELLTAAMQPQLDVGGLTLSAFELLSAIRSSGGKATQADIARRLGIAPPSLSEAVRHAAQRGLLEQAADPSDKRVKRLRLTNAGRKAVHQVLSAVQEAEVDALSGLDPARVEASVSLLREINRNLARRLSSPTL